MGSAKGFYLHEITMITRRSAFIVLAGAVLSRRACAQDQVPGGSVPTPLAFRIARLPVGLDADVLALMATYGEGDDEAKFVMELQSGSHGRFRYAAGSHPVRFFAELGKALAASATRLSGAKQGTLPFDMAILGPPTLRSSGGGYGGGPGDWYTTKIFLGQDQVEVYFNFNLVFGEAEFSIKDESYGNAVVSELSKVIWWGWHRAFS
jgi:hypothetical protein